MNILISDPVKCETIASIFQHMKLFSDNINIMLEEERMFIQTMDSARVSIIEINIPSTWFDKYEHVSRTNITIGINSVILFKILSIRDKSQIIEIQYNDENSDQLLIHFTSSNTSSVFDKHFEVPLIDLDADLMSIPAIDYQAEFTLPTTNFSNLVNQLKIFGDTMDIECSEEQIQLYANSQDCGKMSVEIKIDDLNSFSIDEGEELKLSFSLTHLHNISQFHKLAKDIEIKLNKNFPMNIVYKLGDDNTTLSFYLAPKVQDDE